jgi:excisionase family DNA binding protein
MTAIISITPAYASINDAALITGSSRSTVNRLLANGSLSAVKHGRRTLIPMAALRAYLDALPAATFRAPPKAGPRGMQRAA